MRFARSAQIVEDCRPCKTVRFLDEPSAKSAPRLASSLPCRNHKAICSERTYKPKAVADSGKIANAFRADVWHQIILTASRHNGKASNRWKYSRTGNLVLHSTSRDVCLRGHRSGRVRKSGSCQSLSHWQNFSHGETAWALGVGQNVPRNDCSSQKSGKSYLP